jgi:hypothetical protein
VKVALVLIALVACKGDEKKPAPAPVPAPASGSAPAPAQPSAPICEIGRAAVAGATCTKPEAGANLQSAGKSFDGLIKTVAQAQADPMQLEVMCAQLVLAIERDARKAECTLKLTGEERKQIGEVIDTWYAKRTPIVATGDAAADAVITKIGEVRDATCACKTQACLDGVDKLLAQVPKMADTAPQAARDLGGKLIEDATRCANRVRTIDDPR